MYSAPISFDRQDEGHSAYNPRTWKVITTYYDKIGQYPYKKYGNRQILTGPFATTQNNNKEHVLLHYTNKKDYVTVHNLEFSRV